jgi:hypothetical protein
MATERWVSLPLEGAVLKRVLWEGYGKRSELHIEGEGHPLAIVPLDESGFTVEDRSAVDVRLRSMDDMEVQITLQPAAGHRVLIAEAKIDWWPPESELDELFAEWSKAPKWRCSAAVRVRLRLEPSPEL